MPSTFRNIAKTVSPAVVNIRSTSRQRAQEMTEFFGGGGGGDDLLERFFGGQGGRQQQPRSRPREQETLSAGTGFVISRDGFILTNNHVVEGATKIEVAFFNEEADVYYEAKVVGRDPLTDSALIQLVDAKRDLTEVKFGDSAQMQPGDWVVAIGNPFGLGHTVSVGVISATRASGLPVAQQRRADVLQTDAAINPGQLGRPAAQRARRSDRHQHRHLHRRPAAGQHRHRLRDPDQQRPRADSAAAHRQDHARRDRRPGAADPARYAGRLRLEGTPRRAGRHRRHAASRRPRPASNPATSFSSSTASP